MLEVLGPLNSEADIFPYNGEEPGFVIVGPDGNRLFVSEEGPGPFFAIMCTACSVPHYNVTGLGGAKVEDTHADEHGSWESGKGTTPLTAKHDAKEAAEFKAKILHDQ